MDDGGGQDWGRMSHIIDAHCLPPPSLTPFRLRFSENTEGLVALCE